jgi:septum formation protein
MFTDSAPPRLVLASGSPRRSKLLKELGVDFDIRPVQTDERPIEGESPSDLVVRLAREKARAGSLPGTLVLAADTMVVLDGVALGKPTSDSDAREMLGKLAGRTHTVLTGVALLDVDRDALVADLEASRVEIESLDDDSIRWYVSTGEPLDKAGSYAIQGLGALFVGSVAGNYSNIVGLPLPLTQALFRQLGFDLRQFRQQADANQI